jgi:hypothetical protein
MQAMGNLNHELWSHGHLGVDPACPYPAMNYVDTLPPTRYTNGMGYDDPPHLATVSVECSFTVFMPHFLTVVSPKGPAEQPGNQSHQ